MAVRHPRGVVCLGVARAPRGFLLDGPSVCASYIASGSGVGPRGAEMIGAELSGRVFAGLRSRVAPRGLSPDQTPAFDPTDAEPLPDFVFDQSLPAERDD